MLKSKKGEMTTEEIIGLILGAAIIIVLFGFLLRYISLSFNVGEEGASAYFETFLEEISKADDGKEGEFTLWQVEEDRLKKEWFLIYFGDKYGFTMGDRKFISVGKENRTCVCYWDGQEGVCEENNCKSLKYAINFNGDYGQWIMASGETISIKKVDEEYVIRKIIEGVYTGPTRLMDVKVGDTILDKYGNEFYIESSERNGDYLTFAISDEERNFEGISGIATSELKEYDGLGYTIK